MWMQFVCGPSYAIETPVASETNESRHELCHYLIDVPQNQSAPALGELQGSRSPYAMASTRDENKLSADRLPLHGDKKLHKSLQVGVDERSQEQEQVQKRIHGLAESPLIDNLAELEPLLTRTRIDDLPPRTARSASSGRNRPSPRPSPRRPARPGRAPGFPRPAGLRETRGPRSARPDRDRGARSSGRHPREGPLARPRLPAAQRPIRERRLGKGSVRGGETPAGWRRSRLVALRPTRGELVERGGGRSGSGNGGGSTGRSGSGARGGPARQVAGSARAATVGSGKGGSSELSASPSRSSARILGPALWS